MSDLPFKFPALSIPEPNPGHTWEDFAVVLFNDGPLTVCTKKDIRRLPYVGNLVMDVEGRTWRLEKLIDLGYSRDSWWESFIARRFGMRRTRYELSEQLDLTLEEIKDRLCATILANPEGYTGEAAVEDSTIPQEKYEQRPKELIDKVKATISPLELIATMDFYNYV
jgi:hypothetical protein